MKKIIPYILLLALSCLSYVCFAATLPTTFRHFDTYGRVVVSMAQTNDGKLWLATDYGLLSLDELSRANAALTLRPKELQRSVKFVLHTADDKLLVRLLDGRCMLFDPYESSVVDLRRLLTDQGFIVDGELDCGTLRGVPVIWWNNTLVRLDCQSLLPDSVGRVDGHVVLDTELSDKVNAKIKNVSVTCHAKVMDGKYVVGTSDKGLLILNDKGKVHGHVRHELNRDNSLESDKISAVYNDNHNTLWVAYVKGGVSQYVPDMPPICLHHIPQLESIGSRSDVTSFTYDGDNLYVGTDGNGLFPPISDDMSDKAVTALYVDSHHRLCVGLYQHGIVLREEKRVRSLMGAMSPYSIDEDEKGRLIVGTLGDGLFVEDSDSMRRVDVGAKWILQVCCGKSNVAWLATTDGLVRLDMSTLRKELIFETRGSHLPFTYGRLSSAVADKRGLVWMICSDGENVLNVYDYERDTLYRYPELTKTLRSVVQDADGNIWLAASDMLIKATANYDSNKGGYDLSFVSFPTPFSFNQRAAFLMPDGSLAFGTSDGWLSVGETEMTLGTPDDRSNTLLWIILSVVCVCCVAAYGIYHIKRKKKKTDEVEYKEITVTQPDVTTPDEQFVARATEYVEQHIADSDFSVEQLAAMMGMHRSNLARHLSSSTGLTPLAFIRRVRLLRARHLLENGKMMVSETAYAVGYNSPKIFARQFKEEFGITPSECKK